RTRLQMWDIIRRLVSTGSTIVLTTQYLDEADQLADRMAVIDHGKVVAEDTPHNLKTAVGKVTLHMQLSNGKDFEQAARITEGILGARASYPGPQLITAPVTNPEKVTDLLIALRGEDIRLSSVSMQEPTLDEVFMALTGETKQTEVAAPQ
ncbi:MAG TPA: hypothetical protein VEH01_01570, partial [Nitrososphaerales archaeon]|nr:hypothetical protein [Nitrososphaerales archaeon]